MRRIALVLALSMGGCQLADDQLERDPVTGESKLEREVRAVAPALGPWGAAATALATLAAGVYGAFRSHRADVQTDKKPEA